MALVCSPLVACTVYVFCWKFISVIIRSINIVVHFRTMCVYVEKIHDRVVVCTSESSLHALWYASLEFISWS